MRYATALLSRWSRREWLSIAVVAVTTAFLLGSALLLLTAATYTGTLSSDLSSSATVTYEQSYDDAVAAASADEVVIAVTTVSLPDGETRRVVGVPPDAPRTISGASVSWQAATLPRPPKDGVSAPVSTVHLIELSGPENTVSTSVSPHRVDETLFPDSWYVADTDTVQQLGTSGALVFDTGSSGAPSSPTTVPLIAALPFLAGGITQVVRTLSVAAFAGGLLILVVVYNVTKMSIRDRTRLIGVARATGASPQRILSIILGRVLSLTFVGVALGYALGVIVTNGVVNAATYVGLPVSIQTNVTADIAFSLLGIAGFLLVMGLFAGVLAALPVVRGDPKFDQTHRATSRWPQPIRRFQAVASPTLVDWRAFTPTAATLAVFMLIILLTGSIGGALAPLATTSSGTVVESGAAHPLNSRIDENYATVLRSYGITASPEVIYAQTRGRTPYLVRGANYTAFSSVTDASLVAGTAPQRADEAVVGTDLARTLGLEVGETVTLGGSVTPGVRRVTIVGTFAGSGVTNDQLVVPLETTQPLATGPGTVHLIRTKNASSRLTSLQNRSSGLLVTSLSGPSEVRTNATYRFGATVRNLGSTTASETVTVRVGNRTLERDVTLGSDESTQLSFETSFETAGTYELATDGVTRSVTVYRPNTLQLPSEYPTRAPPGSTLVVPATTPNESVVSGVTVTLDGRSATTDARGGVPIRVPEEPGTYTLRLSKDGYVPEEHTLTVERGAPQRLGGRLTVSPSTGSRLTNPTVTARVANPWGRFLVRNLTLVSPGGTQTRTLELTAGNVSEIELSASEVGLGDDPPPGTYDLRLVVDGTVISTATYRVTGDERVAATLSSRGEYTEGTGIGRAIENVFGNVQLLFVVLVSLAGLSTIGGTTATFAQAVHANRRVIGIYRATGASRRRILALLAADAVRLAIPAAVLSFGLAAALLWVLARVDVLVVFGIRLAVPFTPLLVAASALGAVCLAVCSAVIAATPFVRFDVGRLLHR
ncbi:ABC-type transport system, involved in lipoprotein release, permease component [Haloferax gibbonsii ATCC 33959]|uniref:ABC-type transport system, involved in lipoprotein release, permease component n=1 Tax=Haloferax gibbonsii (strain ATCC 33959 / DSM 4427 / JCM 8863 / NBRC 102184 / NCIMB 2188 / Ma 2.38) TaxID=1227459 RepID=M0H9Q2_HALGM|nr:FtsX-like permease family protein [Haloferax gibbonsii]ELZ79859.1 ABC-type transport system, involved in lipoprotein release, permease component [Haloferax gibbonsii ATCC 33959]